MLMYSLRCRPYQPHTRVLAQCWALTSPTARRGQQTPLCRLPAVTSHCAFWHLTAWLKPASQYQVARCHSYTAPGYGFQPVRDQWTCRPFADRQGAPPAPLCCGHHDGMIPPQGLLSNVHARMNAAGDADAAVLPYTVATFMCSHAPHTQPLTTATVFLVLLEGANSKVTS